MTKGSIFNIITYMCLLKLIFNEKNQVFSSWVYHKIRLLFLEFICMFIILPEVIDSIVNRVSNIFQDQVKYTECLNGFFYVYKQTQLQDCKIRPPCFSDFYVIHSPGFWFDIFIFLNFTQCDWPELSEICLFCRNRRTEFCPVKPRG